MEENKPSLELDLFKDNAAIQNTIMAHANELLDTLLDFKELMFYYSSAIREIRTKLEILDTEFELKYQRNPISSIQTRLKSQVSIMEKMNRKGWEISCENIEEKLNDIAGIRVICSYVDDIYRIADALIKSGIVWRDIIPDNFMRDSDGHLKLIDAQFAIDRNDFREDPFLLKNWSYRMLTFAHHPMTAGYGWNDAAMMLFYTWKLSGSARAQELCDRLRTMSDASNFTVEYGGMDRFRMRIALAVLRMQRAIAGLRGGSAALDTRIARAEAFLKRDCDLWEKTLGIKT